MNNLFLERLKILINEKGIKNKRQLAINMNLPYTTILNWFQNVANPNMETLITLSEFFQCSIDYLCGREDDHGVIAYTPQPTPELSPDEKEILELYRQITPELRDTVHNTLEVFAGKEKNKKSKNGWQA